MRDKIGDKTREGQDRGEKKEERDKSGERQDRRGTSQEREKLGIRRLDVMDKIRLDYIGIEWIVLVGTGIDTEQRRYRQGNEYIDNKFL